MKKYFLLIFYFLVSPVFATNYSLGNTNPFANYYYTPPQQQYQPVYSNKENPTSVGGYFSNNIETPTFKSNHYQHYYYLEKNANELHGCWDAAANMYHLDPWLLMAIAKVESGFNNNAININKNHTVDIGMMQINSIWLPTLRKYGISAKDLLNPCTSVFVGSWIVAQNIHYFGYNMDGIGAYNSPTNVIIRRNYARKVYIAYNQLVHQFYKK